MKNYRQAKSVALYDACVTISNSGITQDNDGYPLALDNSPGSYSIPQSDIDLITSELTKRKSSFPSTRKRSGAIHLKKSLSSYNETLSDNAKIKNLLIRIDGPQLLSIQIVEEHRKNADLLTITNEVTYCGSFSIEWSSAEAV